MPKQNTKQNSTEKPENGADKEVPQPPPFQRKLQIGPVQLIGIPLLAILPILALFGIFDSGMATAHAANDELALQVDYISHYRYTMRDTMTVAVTNLSKQAPATINVAFDRDYLAHFSEINFVPAAEQITDEVYVVEVAGMESGETRLVKLELLGEGYWTQEGTISASLFDGKPVTVTVSTTTYP
ncbi:MAG: hypothetical protein IT328_03075 [Caldilineaceae bacterium]|nr:hypothetical protein [Caldilineaceae bacterium]